MRASTSTADELLETALGAVRGGDGFRDVLDRLPVAVYLTDADGVITYYNPACVELAGRTPVAGRDSWCVTWKIYTQQGEFLPHDQCPMAVAIREQREIRGVEAVAERPDGSRVAFRPYPTPLFDESGVLVGAANMLIDVSGAKEAEGLRAAASKCRRLARTLGDQRTIAALETMAAEYEDQAARLARH